MIGVGEEAAEHGAIKVSKNNIDSVVETLFQITIR